MKNKKIVFLGDSITECFNLKEHFSNTNLINEGKSGHTTIDILNRLTESVFLHEPEIVILLIGTNDLELLSIGKDEVVKNIKKIIKMIKDYNSNIKIYLESIYPVDESIKPFSVGKRRNDDINYINSQIIKIKEATYLDVASNLKNKEGKLINNYTYDGLHLNNEGYIVVTNYLKKNLEFLL